MARNRAAAANAQIRPVTEYVGDLLGSIPALAFGAWDTRARRGVLAQALVGEKGDPSRTFYGAVAQPVQHFTGAAGRIGNPLQYRDGQATLDKEISDESLSNPSLRVFADRLRRRTR